MGVNQPVLDIAYVSEDSDCNRELQQILGAYASPFVSATPRVALEEWKRSSCEHALIVIDGYALGAEALQLCRRLRLAGVAQPIILAWRRNTELDRAVCREFGASALISRPFEPNEVASSIRAAVTDWVALEQSYGMESMAAFGACRPPPAPRQLTPASAERRGRSQSASREQALAL